MVFRATTPTPRTGEAAIEAENRPLPAGITQEEVDSLRRHDQAIEDLLLPNERRRTESRQGWSVFLIAYDDRCRYLSYTDKFIAVRLQQICDPEHPDADPDLVLHDRTMGGTVTCVASGLTNGHASQIANEIAAEPVDRPLATLFENQEGSCPLPKPPDPDTK